MVTYNDACITGYKLAIKCLLEYMPMGVVMVMVHMCLYSCGGDNVDTLTWLIRYKLKMNAIIQELGLFHLIKQIQNSRVLSGERGL